MSGEAIGWAFRKVQIDDPTAKFVLVALCNYANENDEAWPSHNAIARLTGLSRRTIQSSIKKLEDWGVIRRVRQERGNGSETSAKVFLDISRSFVIKGGMAADSTPMATVATPPMESPAIGIATVATLETTCKPHKETTRNKCPSRLLGVANGAIEAEVVSPQEQAEMFFDKQFWPAYPKRYGSNPKEPAKKKIVAAILKGENPREILAGVNRLYAMLQRTGKIGTEYVPMALTWINRKSWKDDPIPAGNGKARGEMSFFDAAMAMESDDGTGAN